MNQGNQVRVRVVEESLFWGVRVVKESVWGVRVVKERIRSKNIILACLP